MIQLNYTHWNSLLNPYKKYGNHYILHHEPCHAISADNILIKHRQINYRYYSAGLSACYFIIDKLDREDIPLHRYSNELVLLIYEET